MPLDLSSVDLPTEVVCTERLVLRPYRPEDADAVHRACQDPAILRWISALPMPYTDADAREWVSITAPGDRAGGRALPTVVEVAGEFMGACGIHFVPGRLGPEIGYWTAPGARGHGYAAEAARGLTDWGLRLGAPRVHLYADARNTASQAVARRAGFTQEGVVRSCLEYRDGIRGDATLFSRLPGE